MKLEDGYWVGNKGNRWTLDDYTKEEALECEDTLVDCSNCTDCKKCIRCSYCVGCRDCNDCARCDTVVKSSLCYGCLSCLRCFNCRDTNNVIDGKNLWKGSPDFLKKEEGNTLNENKVMPDSKDDKDPDTTREIVFSVSENSYRELLEENAKLRKQLERLRRRNRKERSKNNDKVNR